MAVQDAAQSAWSSAHAAAFLHVTAALHAAAPITPFPGLAVIDGLRDRAMSAICKSSSRWVWLRKFSSLAVPAFSARV